MADILENPVDLIDDAYEQEIQVEQEMIEVVAYRSYNQLDDKPQINGVELVGNKTSSDLGITAQIESAINSEAQARAQADNTLQGKIDTEKLARQQADSTLQGNIDAEETARQASDKDIQDVLDGETLARQNADIALGGRIDTEIHDRQVADIGLQGQIDAITSKSDVVDVVATYADLQAYDTQHLGNNDVIKVLDDETHDDALTYYRWSKTNQTWTFIGQEAPYYSKSQTDTLLLGKQNTIDSSHKLSADLVDDTTTTNKFVTAEDKTNWNAKQDALTAGTGIDITGGVISTPAIVPEVVTELPTTGAEGKLYLTPKAHTTSTATGNHIEATVTEQAGQLESFQLYGDTFQQTYTGKNLFVPPESTTSRGVTYTRNDDGSFDISGTATGGESLASIFTDINLQDGDSLTLSSNVAISTGVVYRVEAYNGNSWLVGLISQVTTMPKTITIPSNATRLRYSIGVLENRTVELNNVTFQLEKGSATSYEPFVGGQPSPSPDYPQPIQTVTGLQTVEVHGKNLLRYPYTGGTVGTGLTWTAADDGTIHAVGAIGGGNKSYYLYNRSQSDFDMPEIPAGTYKVFWSIAGSGSSPRITIQDANGYHNSNASNEVTIATSAKPTNIYIQFTGSQSGDVDLYIKPMIVPSDQADVYAPYSHQTLPLDLGNIELCNLGTYQDYIWKDGENWKVHKATKAIYLKDITWLAAPTSVSGKYRMRTSTAPDDILAPDNNNTKAVIKSSVYGVITAGDTYAASATGISVQASTPHIFIYDPNYDTVSSPTAFTQKMASTNATAYYALATATDTTITDTALIAQLEAIRTAALENGANTITNTATGSNLAGDMEIGYYGFAPRNRYDKWLWLDINNNYEQIGS